MMVSCLICIQCSSPLSAEILAALSISSPVRFSSELLITLRTAILRSFKEWPEMASHWFLCPPVCDIIATFNEANVAGVLCLSHVLLSVFPTFNRVNDIPCFAGGCSMYVRAWKAWLVVVFQKVVTVWMWLQVR